MVYRPRGYALPPARGRDALELRPDGTGIEYGSGPDDRGRAVVGRWEDLGSGGMQVTFARGDGDCSTRPILSWAPDMLVLGK